MSLRALKFIRTDSFSPLQIIGISGKCYSDPKMFDVFQFEFQRFEKYRSIR